ncbi:M23 family metallopeptidase [Cyanobium sp. NS01]|uniref:M23 family metallopeptidase n=1 Tax=Cyanobium sp. NS01 TaxID=261284 RepID=UPI001860B812|nr:M23 family metallopeptidase [Cyanobium sp. NS01]QNI70308.1 peptidase M23 family protein [Cyanobium sp. NS01]
MAAAAIGSMLPVCQPLWGQPLWGLPLWGLVLCSLLGEASAAGPLHSPLHQPLPPPPVGPQASLEAPIPDSASGAGATLAPTYEPTRTPEPKPAGDATTKPKRPELVPQQVPVGDLALQQLPPDPTPSASQPPGPLHYPLAVAASEQAPWGWRYSPARGAWRMHTGLDLIAPEGTAVLAVLPGTVQRVAEISGYGLTVLIDHGSGWSSLYAHLLRTSVVAGDSVTAGQTVGLVGQSGNASTAHLHLELRQRQPQGLVAVDPTPLLPAAPSGGTLATEAPTQPIDGRSGPTGRLPRSPGNGRQPRQEPSPAPGAQLGRRPLRGGED